MAATCSVTPGARNFRGVSIKEIASTIPNQTNAAATATAEAACTARSLRQQSGQDGDVAAVEVPGGGDEGDRAATQYLLHLIQRRCPVRRLEL